MIRAPRLGLIEGSPASGQRAGVAGLAILSGLAARGVRVQHFRSRACPAGVDLPGQATGLPGRHLDAWLMPPAVCREVFARGARRADLALIEGPWISPDAASPSSAERSLSGLAPIARSLDLPTVAVVRCTAWDGFAMPYLPPEVVAVVLDGLPSPEDFDRFRRFFRLAARKEVIGAVEALPDIRSGLQRLGGQMQVPQEWLDRLGASFLRFADLGAMSRLAESRPWPVVDDDSTLGPFADTSRRFRVAYAHDEAFGRYCPDTLETLEALGAELVDFSPLRDDSLPANADLVMIGCGFPDQHAEPLAANQSLIGALRLHVCLGRRIYAEGGGAAYLGRSLVLPDRVVAGADIFPFDAVLRADPEPPAPASRTLLRDTWIGPRGATVRGYRSDRWLLEPTADAGEAGACSGPLTGARDLYHRHHAVGSLVHLHLAALPEVVRAFTGPHRPSLNLPAHHRI